MRLWMMAAAMGALTACGIGLDCTEIGCAGSFVVTLADLGAMEEGQLEIEAVFSDDTSSSCGVDLTDLAGGSCVDVAWEGDDLVLTTYTSMGADGASVDITVSLDGVVVHDETVNDLDWSEPFYPNGEACDAGFGCSSTEALLDLSEAVSD